LDAVMTLTSRGADLSIRPTNRANVLHAAANGGQVDCIDWLLAHATFDVNSIANSING
jgi:hypothetical protein